MENEVTLSAVTTGLIIVFGLLVLTSAFIVAYLARQLSALVPPEFATAITELANKALDAATVAAGSRAVELSRKTPNEFDDELVNTVINRAGYDIVATDGGYTLVPRRETVPDDNAPTNDAG